MHSGSFHPTAKGAQSILSTPCENARQNRPQDMPKTCTPSNPPAGTECFQTHNRHYTQGRCTAESTQVNHEWYGTTTYMPRRGLADCADLLALQLWGTHHTLTKHRRRTGPSLHSTKAHGAWIKAWFPQAWSAEVGTIIWDARKAAYLEITPAHWRDPENISCGRCVLADLCCNCEACSLHPPWVAMTNSDPDISRPEFSSPDPYPSCRTDRCKARRGSLNSMVQYELIRAPRCLMSC